MQTNVHLVKAMVFPVWMWELYHKEGWVPKNWCFWIVVLEKTLESPFNCKEIKPVSIKGNQSWIFIGRTDAETEAPVLWPPAAKSWLIGKDPDAGKAWKQEEKGMTEDEMAGWHHGFNGHGFGSTLGVGDGQGGLACCSSWGHKESDTTELNCIYMHTIWKSRDITLLTKVHTVKAMFFPTVMYRCESRTRKKAERQRTDTFELQCWKSLLRVPWTARRSSQSILKGISPE